MQSGRKSGGNIPVKRKMSLSPRKKKPPAEGEELESTPSMTSRISRLLRGESGESNDEAPAGEAPEAPVSVTKRRAFLHGERGSIFSGLGEASIGRNEESSTPPPSNFVLKEDFRNVEHLRMLSKLIGVEISVAVGDDRKDSEEKMLTRMERMEAALELTAAKTNEIFDYLHECALGSSGPAPGLQRVDNDDPYDAKKDPLVLAPQHDAPVAKTNAGDPLLSAAVAATPPSPSMRVTLDPPSVAAAEAPLSVVVPSVYDRAAYVHRDLKASLSRMDLTQAKGGQEQALWEEPVAPSPVVHKIGAITGQERKRVRRSRQGRADAGGALRPSSLVASLADGVSDLAEGITEGVSELASNVARPIQANVVRPIQDNVVRPIGVGVQALASIGQATTPLGLTDGLVAPRAEDI